MSIAQPRVTWVPSSRGSLACSTTLIGKDSERSERMRSASTRAGNTSGVRVCGR